MLIFFKTFQVFKEMISEGPVIEMDDSEVQTSMINYMYITCIPLNCNY